MMGLHRWTRRWVVGAGLLLLAGTAAAIAWPRVWRGPSGTPSRHGVVFLGNSITSGDGVTSDATFAHRLGVALAVPVWNAGVSGDTTTGAL